MSEFRSRWTSWTPQAQKPAGAEEGMAGEAPQGQAPAPVMVADSTPANSVSSVSCQPGGQAKVHVRGEEEEVVDLHAPRAREAGVGDRTDKTAEIPPSPDPARPPVRECIPCRLWTEFSRCPRCRVHLGGPPDDEPLPRGWDDFAPPLPPCPVPCGGGWGNPHVADCPRGRRGPRGWAVVGIQGGAPALAAPTAVIGDSNDEKEAR